MQDSRPKRSPLLFPAGLALAGCAVLGAVAWIALQPAPPHAAAPRSASAPAPPMPPPPLATATTVAPAPVPATDNQAKPSFDIVRVAPTGDAVIAGRAAPDSAVTLRENGTTIGEAKADAQGQFVIVPAKPIAPGATELSLSARNAAGNVTLGSAPVTVLVAPPAASSPAPPAAPIVMQTSPTEPPRLLQPPPAAGTRLTLDVVDYDAAGHIRFAGRAPPGRSIRLYVDNAAIGDARSDASGNWGLMPQNEVAIGDHALRVDLLADASGKVQSRVELPFQRAAIPAEARKPATAGQAVQKTRIVVQPRQNLWRIARDTYGQGVRYTEIFAANREQIRDPNLIYPGQVFALPGSTPASTKSSR